MRDICRNQETDCILPSLSLRIVIFNRTSKPINVLNDQLLRHFLDRFSVLTEEDKAGLTKQLVVKSYTKGTMLQEEGKVPKHCYYILQGCVRQYQIIDGLEKTTEFYTPEHGTVSPECYATEKPSYFFLECTEDTVLLVGDRERDRKLYADYPVLSRVIMEVMEAEWLKVQQNLTHFKLSSPLERYTNLLDQRSDLLQRVPSHQIASYLGITAESLSRIRKRITQRSQL